MSIFDPHNPYTNYPRQYRQKLVIEDLPDIHAFDEPFIIVPSPTSERLESMIDLT